MPKFSDVNRVDHDDATILVTKAMSGLHSLAMAQGIFSFAMFGDPTFRTPAAVLDHVRKEVEEIALDPSNRQEWADLVILALDGLRRACWLHNRQLPKGGTVSAQDPADVIGEKMLRNFGRDWPALEDQDPTRAVEHVRTAAEQKAKDAELPAGLGPVDPIPPKPDTRATLAMWAQQLRDVVPHYGYTDVQQLLVAAGLIGPATPTWRGAPPAAIPADHVKAFNQLAHFNAITKIAGYESLPHFLLTALADLGHIVEIEKDTQ